MPRIIRTPLTTLALIVAVAVSASGCSTLTHVLQEKATHVAAQALAANSNPASAAPAPAASTGLRAVSSPGTVAADESLHPGQCHIRDVDAQLGLVLPDSSCTPGATDPAVTQANIQQTICTSGYTGGIRPPASVTDRYKQQALSEYGLPSDRTTEYDHLVSLQLGGANAVSNLWPEPNRSGAPGTTNPKDAVENSLHRAVCSGRITLAEAQLAIATDWTTADAKLGLK
jgi:hypothetical protein